MSCSNSKYSIQIIISYVKDLKKIISEVLKSCGILINCGIFWLIAGYFDSMRDILINCRIFWLKWDILINNGILPILVYWQTEDNVYCNLHHLKLWRAPCSIYCRILCWPHWHTAGHTAGYTAVYTLGQTETLQGTQMWLVKDTLKWMVRRHLQTAK